MPHPTDKITEQPSKYRHLEQMPLTDILKNINKEDKSVPLAIEKVIPAIQNFIEAVVGRLKKGGRLFYIGAGTSGRLGVLDASECPPTYGVSPDMVIGLIAGGDQALRTSVESAEDSTTQAWEDLQEFQISKKDIILGIAASGTTPYVIGGLKVCQEKGITTGCLTCNPNTPLAKVANYPIEVVVGPEFVTGSTRMKAGTAQKMVLNMISTSTMIQLGRIKDNRMIDMQLNNAKLVERGVYILQQLLEIEKAEATLLLEQYGSVRKAMAAYKKDL